MLEDYIQQMGGLPNFAEAFQRGQLAPLQLQQAHQQVEAGAAQLEAQQAQQQRQQAYSAAIRSAIANPSAKSFSDLQLQFPEAHESIKGAWDMQDKQQQTANEHQLSVVYSLLNNGKVDAAKTSLQARLDSDKAAGHQEPAVEQLLATLNDDPTGATAKGLSALYLSAGPNGDRFKTVLGNGGKPSTHVITAGGALVDDTGKELYRADDKTEYKTIKNVDGTESIVAVGGGQPSSAQSGQRYTGGWTPRAANGGDNSDAAVDGKIAGAARSLGVDPRADISSISPMKIAQAMALSEGGAGSLADRNNNPGNLRNGDGSYKKFPSKQAGLTAAAALVSRKLKNGQTTVKSMIEGLPVGGANGVVYTSNGPVESDLTGPAFLATLPVRRQETLKAIAEGRTAAPKPGTRFGQALLEQVAQYDPTFDAANAASRQKTRVDFTSGKSAIAVNALNTAMGHLLHLDDQANDLGNFSTMPGFINPLYNKARRAGGNTALPAFEQTKQAASSEMRKVFAGAGGGNLTELQEWQDSLNSSQSFDQLHSAIKNGVVLMSSRLDALKDQYTTGMGRSDQVPTFLKPSLAKKANERFGVDLSHNADSPDERRDTKSAAPVKVATRAEAMALPSGTRFITPDGRVKVRP